MVSVIIPVYNREDKIKKCINSVISQTYKDLEIIIVDDGSTDNTGSICDDFAQKDSRVKAIHISNSGVAFARNVGMDSSKGEYITFVDSDDYVSSGYVEKLLQPFDLTECSISICNIYEESKTELTERIYPYTGICKSDKYLSDMLYGKIQGGLCWGKLYKKDELKNRFRKYKYCEDVFFVFEYLNSCSNNIAIVSDCLYYYVRHENSITGLKKTEDLLDSVLVSEEINKFCDAENSILTDSSRAYVVESSFFAYLNSINDETSKNLRNRCVGNIKKYRKKIIADGNATFKTKVACIISFFSMRILSLVYKFVA